MTLSLFFVCFICVLQAGTTSKNVGLWLATAVAFGAVAGWVSVQP